MLVFKVVGPIGPKGCLSHNSTFKELLFEGLVVNLSLVGVFLKDGSMLMDCELGAVAQLVER